MYTCIYFCSCMHVNVNRNMVKLIIEIVLIKNYLKFLEGKTNSEYNKNNKNDSHVN